MVQAQQGRPGQVDLQDPPLAIPQEIPDRGEIEQIVVLFRCLLGRRLGALQFLVLHFQFDLVDLQLVDEGPCVDLAQAFGRGWPSCRPTAAPPPGDS